MSKVVLIAKITCAEGKNAELEAGLAALIAAADEESGLEVYSAHRDNADENTYYFFEMYTDQASLDVHGKGEQMKVAMGALGACLGGAPEISMLTPVAAKGLDIG